MVLPFQASGDATPGMQLSLRTKQTKSLKRGRKSKKGQNQKAETKKGRNRKRNVLAKSKQDKAKSTSKEKSKPERKRKTNPKLDNKEKKNKTNAKNNGSDAAAVKQERVGKGKSWRYEILPDQVYGCSNCRFIFGGCQGCWKENFKGKTAAMLREELEAKDAGTEKEKAKTEQEGGEKKRRRTKGSWENLGLVSRHLDWGVARVVLL